MSRLFYEKQKRAGLVPDAETTQSTSNFNEYLAKVAALVPAEIIAGYLTMFGLVSAIGNENAHTSIYWLVFAACLILTPIYLNGAADEGKPKRNHLIISTLAFIVWAYVTTGDVLSATIAENAFDPAIASILLILFSLITGRVPLNK